MTTERAASPVARVPYAEDSLTDTLRDLSLVERPNPAVNTGRMRDGTLAQFGPLGEPEGEQWHVFLSHSGAQKRGFVDFLLKEFNTRYPALNVFVDEYSLNPGSDALKAMHAALSDARVAVVVLSEEFISSKFPMEELHLLLERCSNPASKAVIVPVFYSVTWDQVFAKCHKPTAAAGAEAAHANLAGISCITGVRPDQVANARDTDLVQSVVEHVAKALLRLGGLPTDKLKNMPPILVGLDDKCNQVVQLLTAEGKTRTMLLTGMAGIGKTTLAKAVFNKLHDADRTLPCHFTELGPGIKDPKELLPEQAKLLKELALNCGMAPADSDQALKWIAAKLQGRKVLLVVDNVWGPQLEWLLPGNILDVLGEGSMVLITSRDRAAARHLSSAANSPAGGRLVHEEVQLLTPEQAMELFCWHAIGVTSETGLKELRRVHCAGGAADLQAWLVEEVCKNVLCSSYNSSSNSMSSLLESLVKRCDGLPMALEVVAKHLAGLDSGRAQAFIARPHLPLVYASVMFKALKQSWDALDLDEQKRFMLDVAWFLKGRSWGLVECYGKTDVLQTLQKLGLVQKSSAEGADNGRLREEQPAVRVHPVVVDFCKLDIENLVSEAESQLRVEYHAEANPTITLDSETLKDVMPKNALGLSLRGWRLEDAAFPELKQRGSKLRVLQMECQEQPMPLALRARSMPWLEVEDASELRLELQSAPLVGSVAEGVVLLEHSSKLKSVKLAKSKSPPQLKGLWITECTQLVSVDILGLAALQQLRIAGCPSLERMENLGCLAQLELLELSGCSVQVVASCLESCASLTKLAIASCPTMLRLPDLPTLCRPLVLRQLTVQGCKNLLALPCLQRLSHLSSLELLGCENLERVQLPSSLKCLLVHGCASLHAVAGLAHPTLKTCSCSPAALPIRHPPPPKAHTPPQPSSQPLDSPPPSPPAHPAPGLPLEPSPVTAAALTHVSISACGRLLPLPCLGHLQQLQCWEYHLEGTGLKWPEQGGSGQLAEAGCPCRRPDMRALFKGCAPPMKVLSQVSTFGEKWSGGVLAPLGAAEGGSDVSGEDGGEGGS